MKKITTYLDRPTLRTLYFSLIFPYLSYCHLAWGSAPAIHTNRLLLLQKKAIRLIHHAPSTVHTDPLFTSSNIIKFTDLYLYFCTLFIYKYKHNLLPTSFIVDTDWFHPQHLRHSHSTRLMGHIAHCIVPRCRTSLCQRFLRYKSSVILNKFIVPLNLLDQESIAALKSLLKHILN